MKHKGIYPDTIPDNLADQPPVAVIPQNPNALPEHETICLNCGGRVAWHSDNPFTGGVGDHTAKCRACAQVYTVELLEEASKSIVSRRIWRALYETGECILPDRRLTVSYDPLTVVVEKRFG